MTSSPASSPVRLLTSASEAPAVRHLAAMRPNSSSIGFISGEWNACDTVSRLLRMPCAANAAATARTRASSPDEHHRPGPLTAAIDTRRCLRRHRCRDLRLRRIDRHHRAARRQRLHQPATRSHQPRGVLQREHPRHTPPSARRWCARNNVRLHPPRPPQRRKRYLQRKQRRLRATPSGRAAPPACRLRPHHLAQRAPRDARSKRRKRRIQRLAEHRPGLVKPPAHPGLLRALARKQPRKSCRACAPAPRTDPTGGSPRDAAASAAISSSRVDAATASRCSWWLRVVARL